MNLPPEFWRVTVTGITHPETRRVINKYLVNINSNYKDGYGLRLYGDPGVGKTSIAALIAKEARSWKYTVYFMMIWEMREAIRSRIQFEDQKSILDRCREVDVLVLDGFVEEDIDERLVNARMLEQLITYRGQRGRLTVITTRIGLKDFETGKGLASFEAGTQAYLCPLEVEGENHRLTRAEVMQDKILGADE
jgi:DNA replication protein DnaC